MIVSDDVPNPWQVFTDFRRITPDDCITSQYNVKQTGIESTLANAPGNQLEHSLVQVQRLFPHKTLTHLFGECS